MWGIWELWGEMKFIIFLIMKRGLLLFLALFLAVCGQGKLPPWVEGQSREAQFPQAVYLTGFAESKVLADESLEVTTSRLKRAAQVDLVEKILVSISSTEVLATSSVQLNSSEEILQIYASATTAESSAELNGAKTETFYDKRHKTVYAFAYANRRELMAHYRNSLDLHLQQAAGALKTAGQWERDKATKAKARQLCRQAVGLLAQAEQEQRMLMALDRNATGESLQHEKSQTLRNTAVQMLARVVVSVYVKSSEEIGGKKVSIIANKVKAALADNGMSCTDELGQASFVLTITAVARQMGAPEDIVFCTAEVEVELVNCHTGNSVYGDEFSQKGGGTSYERAGRKAFEEVAGSVADKVMERIFN